MIKERVSVKHLIDNYTVHLAGIDPRHLRLVVYVAMLVLFVLAGGAPEGGDGCGGC